MSCTLNKAIQAFITIRTAIDGKQRLETCCIDEYRIVRLLFLSIKRKQRVFGYGIQYISISFALFLFNI